MGYDACKDLLDKKYDIIKKAIKASNKEFEDAYNNVLDDYTITLHKEDEKLSMIDDENEDLLQAIYECTYNILSDDDRTAIKKLEDDKGSKKQHRF